MEIEKLIEQLRWWADNCDRTNYGCQARPFLLDAATALSALQAENEKLRTDWEKYQPKEHWETLNEAVDNLRADLARVTAERDAAKEAVKNMAEYIVCAGRVDYFLCDEISKEHHLKYQPKNDGNYDNEPCYKCVADWFLQGHKWQGSNW